ncbi:ABC transporter ATP-binding protein [Georgenia subflava]|uniref:ATP-binding cassette domain-containing protein n=1 Tax=Georgenia subflava TaxID=1622177 RepID=A0A6N7ENF9_9MICO|nr:ABC transporter ATP-binding protein [Georgenia subflava]MPV36754.1 ATP-binding cassette domain-containing protein [Georgenia subflava]
MSEPLLSVADLVTEFDTQDGLVRAVDHVSFDVGHGEVVAVVGESGSGKSVTMMSLMGLLSGAGRVVHGRAVFDGRDLLDMTDDELRRIRGDELSIIFQDPLTSLNPVITVGDQIAEAVLTHRDVSRQEALDRATELLTAVGVAGAEQRVNQYPHEFSGGMRQRVMIAIAIANRPKLLIADEPTTALDVTVQAQVLELLAKTQQDLGSSTIFITHDLGVVAEMADRVVVMYAGRVVETGLVHDIFREPRHPYTRGLLASRPGLEGGDRLPAIPGQAPSLLAMPTGCTFHPRCDQSHGRAPCWETEPALRVIDENRASRCHYHEELAHDPAGESAAEGRR